MDTDTARDIVDQIERLTLRVVWSAGTHVGKVREVNEDGFVATAGMWVVADGMGGHSAGRVASEIVVGVCSERAGGEPMELAEVPSMLETANRKVRQRALADGYDMMGSTVCGIALVDNGGDEALLLFNVGDSRCYQFTEGSDLRQLTIDHSYVQELVERGDIAPDEARTHPDRNVVSRAIGIEDSVAPDYRILSMPPTSRLLLCSDGVSGELDDDAIAEILAGTSTPSDTANSLLDEVIAGAARDNATVVVLDVTWHGDEPEVDTRTNPNEVTAPRGRSQQDRGGDEAESRGSALTLIDEVPGFVVVEPTVKVSERLVDSLPTDMPLVGDDPK